MHKYYHKFTYVKLMSNFVTFCQINKNNPIPTAKCGNSHLRSDAARLASAPRKAAASVPGVSSGARESGIESGGLVMAAAISAAVVRDSALFARRDFVRYFNHFP